VLQSCSVCHVMHVRSPDVLLTAVCRAPQTGSRLKTVVAAVIEGTMQLVVDRLAEVLRQERQQDRDAASAPEPVPPVGLSTVAAAQNPALATADAGAYSMSPSGKWDLVFSRQSRH